MQYSDTMPLIGAVLVDRCSDAESLFAAVAAHLRHGGCRVAGVEQINRARAGRRRCDMTLRDLAGGETICISEDRGSGARGCRLDHAALAVAAQRVLQSIAQGADLVIVNKFGKAESEGGGMREVVALALAHGIPVLICANPEHHAHLMAFTGELAIALPPSQAAILDWLTAAAAPRWAAA